jgi:pentatricopeptide repeat protein
MEGFAGRRANEILEEMKTLGEKDPDVLPDTITYCTVINVWAKTGHADRANSLLSSMYDDYMAGKGTAKPDLRAFNTVLFAYSKSDRKDAPQQAEAFFDRMKKIANDGLLEIHPDIFTINTCTCRAVAFFDAFGILLR